MAFRDTAKSPSFIRNLPQNRDSMFFNTDGFVAPLSKQNLAVRFGPPNLPDDVMLVQFFLKKIAENPGKFDRPFFPPRQHLLMKVDGKFGEITRTWIEKFQNHLNNIGRTMLRDGVVDRVRNGTSIGERGRLFTLAMLNVAMGQVTGDDGWDTWWKASDVPGLLRGKIQNPATFL
jgi:hypothetical protein